MNTLSELQTGNRYLAALATVVLHFPNGCLDFPRSTVIKLRHGKPSLGSCQAQPAFSILDNFILNQV